MHSIQSIGVVSCAKVLGVVYAALGLLLVPFFLVAMLVGAFAGKSPADHLADAIAIIVGLVLMVLVPVLYGAMGFAMGALGAWIYNIAAKKLGGIEIELRDSTAPTRTQGSLL